MFPAVYGMKVTAAAGGWTPASVTTVGGVLPHTWHYAGSGGVYQDAGTTPVGGDGDVIGRTANQGSDSHNADQGTAANKPTWRTNVLNGKPVFRFDGVNDFLQGTFTGALSQPFTIFAVAKLDPTAVNDGVQHTLMDGSDTNNMRLTTAVAPSPDVWQVAAGANLSDGPSDSNWNIWTVLFNATSSQMRLNGVSMVAGAGGSENPVGITIGNAGIGSQFWKGDVAEILIYNSDLVAADANEVGNYLATKYGLMWTNI